jgi:L-asparaginase
MAVVVVSTGGTIASVEDEEGDGGASPELTAEGLVGAVPGLEALTEVRTRDFATVPSPHLTVDDLYELSGLLAELDADPDIEGVVITQGTDTLEESSYFLDRCYGGETPVVVTGAMRNPSLASPDGPNNLLASVRTALSPGAAGKGVLVCLNERVHPATTVTKVHTTNADTFRSPEFGPLAAVEEDRVTWAREPADVEPTLDPDPDALTNDVHAVTVTVDTPRAQLRAAEDAAALCVAATGAGHVPLSAVEELERLAEAGVPLVATSRCPEGRLARSTYDFRGSERTLRELGCHFSPRNLQKTRVGTILGLAAGRLEELYERPG